VKRRVFLQLLSAIAAASRGLDLRAQSFDEIADDAPVEQLLAAPVVESDSFLARAWMSASSPCAARVVDSAGRTVLVLSAPIANCAVVVDATYGCPPVCGGPLRLEVLGQADAMVVLDLVKGGESPRTLRGLIDAFEAGTQRVVLVSGAHVASERVGL
jgi:hypothetical protein